MSDTPYAVTRDHPLTLEEAVRHARNDRPQDREGWCERCRETHAPIDGHRLGGPVDEETTVATEASTTLVGEFDAQEWARQWLEVISAHPEVPTDEGTMIGWFANALMAGYDQARREKDDVIEELLEAIRLTQEYAQLPAVDGWSWWDAYSKHRPEDAERLRREVVTDRDVLTYDGSFELDFLLEGEEVGAAGDGSTACLIYASTRDPLRVEVGDTVVRNADGTLSIRPVDNQSA